MKPQVQRRVTSQNFFIKQIDDGKYSVTVSAVKSWNKIQKQLKDMLLKDLPPGKLKQLLVVFTLNHINSSLIMQKIDLDM